jgi:serine/threonine protein kinase
MNPTACPAADELSAFNLGKLDDQRGQSVAQHLAQCSACQTTLDALEVHADSLIAQLRHEAPEAIYAHEPALHTALQKIQALTPERLTHAVPGRLREYQLLERLGQGSMGAVYKVRHTRLNRLLALKILPPERMNDPATMARFQREMEAVGRLNHAHVVRATDAGEVDGMHFLVMEIVEGQTLTHLVRTRGPLPVATACELVRQTALGLQHVHEHGLVHRDIKPSNLLLGRDGVVKVLDLGLALLKKECATEELTETGLVMGTLDYMAPEQFENSHAVDIRADIYSLGCTLYFLLTGQAPFSDPAHGNRLKKRMAHAQEPVPPIRQHRGDVPTGLADVLNRMLAKAPGDRFATPAEVAAALTPFAAPLDPAALGETPAVKLRKPRRHRLAVIAVLVGVVILAGGLLTFGLGRGGSSERAGEIRDIRAVAKLRSADLLQKAQNTHDLLRAVRDSNRDGPQLNIKINDLNNNLSDLWLALAGYGLGREPYLDTIQLSNSGFNRAKPPPSFTITGPYNEMGLPRLYEHFLEASGVKGKAAEKQRAEFENLVRAYANPAVFPHRDFYERAYSDYRQGKELFTRQYQEDLQSLEKWLTELENVLAKVPEYFEKAP